MLDLLCRGFFLVILNFSNKRRMGRGTYSGAALINFFVPNAALIRGRRFVGGSAYSSELKKYGNHFITCCGSVNWSLFNGNFRSRGIDFANHCMGTTHMENLYLIHSELAEGYKTLRLILLHSSQHDAMANLTRSNSTNITNEFSNATKEASHATDVSVEVSFIITIITNSITCPFTVLLNVLVIMAVKRRPRLQSNANILLACLAVTDALTGLTAQPSFVLLYSSRLLGVKNVVPYRVIHNFFTRALSLCSCLHLMLVTYERLVAIKFPMNYYDIVTRRKIKVAVISCWILSLSCEVFRRFRSTVKIANLLIAISLISGIIFVTLAYVLLYLETLRHRKMMKAQQLPQQEVERFVKENKALKTTVLVVCSVVICFLPMSFVFTLFVKEIKLSYSESLVRTFAMLNSLVNPLIYCWRQEEMRKFVFSIRTQVVNPVNWKPV